MRFPILKLMSPYKPSRQRFIVIACCVVHNYTRKWNLSNELFRICKEMDPIELEGIQEGPRRNKFQRRQLNKVI